MNKRTRIALVLTIVLGIMVVPGALWAASPSVNYDYRTPITLSMSGGNFAAGTPLCVDYDPTALIDLGYVLADDGTMQDVRFDDLTGTDRWLQNLYDGTSPCMWALPGSDIVDGQTEAWGLYTGYPTDTRESQLWLNGASATVTVTNDPTLQITDELTVELDGLTLSDTPASTYTIANYPSSYKIEALNNGDIKGTVYSSAVTQSCSSYQGGYGTFSQQGSSSNWDTTSSTPISGDPCAIWNKASSSNQYQGYYLATSSPGDNWMGGTGGANYGGTIELWFKKYGSGWYNTSQSGTSSGKSLVSKGWSQYGDSFYLFLYSGDGGSTFQVVYRVIDYPNAYSCIWRTTNSYPANVWTHIAVTKPPATGDAPDFYINGSLVSRTTYSSGCSYYYYGQTSDGNGSGCYFTFIGQECSYYGGAYPYPGMTGYYIDEIRFWDDRRTASEISANYQTACYAPSGQALLAMLCGLTSTTNNYTLTPTVAGSLTPGTAQNVRLTFDGTDAVLDVDGVTGTSSSANPSLIKAPTGNWVLAGTNDAFVTLERARIGDTSVASPTWKMDLVPSTNNVALVDAGDAGDGWTWDYTIGDYAGLGNSGAWGFTASQANLTSGLGPLAVVGGLPELLVGGDTADTIGALVDLNGASGWITGATRFPGYTTMASAIGATGLPTGPMWFLLIVTVMGIAGAVAVRSTGWAMSGTMLIVLGLMAAAPFGLFPWYYAIFGALALVGMNAAYTMLGGRR